MSASSKSGPADGATISRRDAIMGALALAAGALVATRPEPAQAYNGQTLTVGGIHFSGGGTYIWRTVDGYLNPTHSTVMLAGDNGSGAYHRAVEGKVQSLAGYGAAGVFGSAATVGQTGVVASHDVAGGTALQVNGKAAFSRSGIGTILKGNATCTVAVPSGIDVGAMIHVTLQANAGNGTYLRFARRLTSTTFRVYLNKAATTTTATFAWFIVG